MSNVIKFKSPTTELMSKFKASLALETEKAAQREAQEREDRKQAGLEARQVIARGVGLLREAEGVAVADEWLVQCMSVVRTIGE